MPRRATTQHTNRTRRSVRQPAQKAITRGYGGFPYPQTLILQLIKKLFPGLEEKFVRTVTLPRTQTLGNSFAPITGTEYTKDVRYISFRAVVGRNSKFHLLTEENLEELGGVEYRALTALLWIVGGVRIPCFFLRSFILSNVSLSDLLSELTSFSPCAYSTIFSFNSSHSRLLRPTFPRRDGTTCSNRHSYIASCPRSGSRPSRPSARIRILE